jgi:hypothetical protein
MQPESLTQTEDHRAEKLTQEVPTRVTGHVRLQVLAGTTVWQMNRFSPPSLVFKHLQSDSIPLGRTQCLSFGNYCAPLCAPIRFSWRGTLQAAGAHSAWNRRRNCARVLHPAHRLHQPRRRPPRHEPSCLDAPRNFYPQCARHRFVFRPAETTYLELSAMQCARRTWIWLLPSMPVPIECLLSAMPAQREWGRQILPALRPRPSD